MGARPILLNLMALRQVPQGFDAIDWMPPATDYRAGGHPTWVHDANRLRSGSGPLIPALLRRYGRPEDSDVLAIGFSAGSNSGLRELLRDPQDREQLVGVVALDGLHSSLKTWVKDAPSVRDRYADWTGQMSPFEDYMRRAADGDKLMVATASDVAAPPGGITKTRDAWLDIVTDLANLGVPVHPLASSLQETLTGTDGRSVSWFPAPGATLGDRGYVLFFEGNQARDHVQQAQAVAPWILGKFVLPFLAERNIAG
jgi:hypothetical protein